METGDSGAPETILPAKLTEVIDYGRVRQQ